MSRSALLTLALASILVAFAEPALAAPGGKIARAVFETFWGRVALVGLVIIFAPLIVLSLLREWRATRRARADLATLALHAPVFRWLDLRERALACFDRVHAAWRNADTSEARDCMTGWYWRNQQLAVLDRWAAQGLQNHCDVKSVRAVEPVLVQPVAAGDGFEGSKVVLAITANMQDYLARRDSGEIVEGSLKYKDVQALWTFELRDGEWRVCNIEEDAMLDEYISIARALPPVAECLRGPGMAP